MKAKIDRRSLVNSLGAVFKAIPAHTTMPILTCVLVSAADGKVELLANDMEMAIKADIECEVIESGMIAVEAKLLLDIAKKLTDNDVLIETDDAFQVGIKCGKAKFKLAGRDGSEFPGIPEVEPDDDVTISQFTLKEIIGQTIFSIAENDVNKVMGGELFEINGDKLTVTALDGHRIAIRKVDLRNSYQPVKVIVPGKVLMDLSKIVTGEASEDVQIEFCQKHIRFMFDNMTVVSRLIEGKYFDVAKMVSSNYDISVTINRRDLIESIDRAALLVKEGDKKPIIIEVGNNEMRLSVTSSMGSMHDTLDVAQDGGDIKIGFNPKFVNDALRAIDEDEVTLYFTTRTAPCVIKDEGYFYLILPVNFGGA